MNYAEAVFERDGAISDDDLNLSLNLVRCRVNTKMPKLTNSFVSEHGLDMRTEIRRERTIELYNEGFRLDDLKRWNAMKLMENPKTMFGLKITPTVEKEYEEKRIKGSFSGNLNEVLTAICYPFNLKTEKKSEKEIQLKTYD